MAEGIEVHVAKDGTRSYRASVWSNREGKLLRKSFPSQAAAKIWRSDAKREVRRGPVRAAAAPTLAATIGTWIDGAEAGTIRKRGRGVFAPSTIAAVRQNYTLRLADEFGTQRLDHIRLQDVQEYVDQLDAAGTNASTIEGTILPLRLAYRYARGKGIVHADPTDGLELPQKVIGAPSAAFPRGCRPTPRPRTGTGPSGLGHGDARRPPVAAN